nr:PTS fructose transporter subunit IIA [Tepidimonas alkaliphilus]
MVNGILVIAHAPLASALRQCVLHVFPEAQCVIDALDVPPDQPPEVTLAQARARLAARGGGDMLVLTDLIGATPCNVAAQLGDGVHTFVVTGVNLPMLLRAFTYRHEPIASLAARATAGGAQGVMPLKPATPCPPGLVPPSPAHDP